MKPFLYKKYQGIYYYFFHKNGRRTNVSTGRKNRSEAEKWVKENYPNRVEANYKTTIEEYFNIYLKYSEMNLAPNTHNTNKNTFNQFRRINSKVYIKDIHSQDLEDFKNELTKTISKQSANVYLRHLKSALTHAFNNNYTGTNPGSKVKSFQQPEKEILSFTEPQIKQLLKLSPADFVPIIKFALLTGMRLSEIRNCQWSDIKGDILTIGKDFHTKSKKIRKLYISSQLREVLNGLDKNSDYLFHYKDASSISKVFTKILRKGNFPDKFHFHCLRHTFITNMLNAGVPIVKVKEIAGHSDIKTTMRYAHISSIDKEAMEMVRV